MKYMTQVRKFGAKINKAQIALGAAMFAPVAAFAQGGFDVSGTVTEVGSAKTAVMAIGAAVLAVIVGIMLYKWAKRAL